MKNSTLIRYSGQHRITFRHSLYISTVSDWLCSSRKVYRAIIHHERVILKKPFCTTSKRWSRTHLQSAEQEKAAPNRGTDHLAKRAKEKLFDKEFFFDLLSSSATKRDARAYISRLKSSEKVERLSRTAKHQYSKLDAQEFGHGVNLATVFGHGRAVEDRALFKQNGDIDLELDNTEATHIALIKISGLQHQGDETVHGIAQTLSQLTRLGMVPCIVIDTKPDPKSEYHLARGNMIQQADRLVYAIEKSRGAHARRLDGNFQMFGDYIPKVVSRRLLLRSLRDGSIPVIIPVAIGNSSQQAVIVPADDIVVALTRELAGLDLRSLEGEAAGETAARSNTLQKQISLDRIIVLDPAGAISSAGSQGKRHIFVNLEQEYEDIKHELRQGGMETSQQKVSLVSGDQQLEDHSAVHMQNLNLLRSVLSLLPPSSSAIITTPNEAAMSSQISHQAEPVSHVGTRRQRNPLIHNLLTDKPAYSSSLPPGRMGMHKHSENPHVTSTFLKKGMPLTMIPDPRVHQWTSRSMNNEPRITLHDPRIDLGRLIHLIEDSFRRKLDVEDYLNRVNSRIAGLIIAGNYEGGAVLTWETPPGASDSDTARLVPYLDKFAVLQRSQGAGGVADIVFNAMVRGCFPDGVCWRSRRDNPVNKWYFERARGTCKVANTEWTMFWTTPGILVSSPSTSSSSSSSSEKEQEEGNQDPLLGQRLFRDYEGVCRQVKPSWSDGKGAE